MNTIPRTLGRTPCLADRKGRRSLGIASKGVGGGGVEQVEEKEIMRRSRLKWKMLIKNLLCQSTGILDSP